MGIDGPPPLDAATAQGVIARSVSLTAIVTLLREHESHPRTRFGDMESYDYAIYYSDTFKDFVDARRVYMERFNRTVAQHLSAQR